MIRLKENINYLIYMNNNSFYIDVSREIKPIKSIDE